MLAVGRPAGWVADRLPLTSASNGARRWLSPGENQQGGPGGVRQRRPPRCAGAAGQIPTVTPDAFAAQPRSAPPSRPGGPCGRCSSRATRCPSRSTTTSPSARPEGRSGGRGSAPRHRDLHHLPRRLGLAGRVPGQALPPERGRRVHRRRRRLSDDRAERARKSMLRRGMGRDLRQPGAPDGEHLPSGRRRPRLLDDPADAARGRSADDRPRRQRRDRSSRPAVGRPGAHHQQRADLHPRRRLPRRDERQRPSRRSSGRRTAFTSTKRDRACSPASSCGKWGRNSTSERHRRSRSRAGLHGRPRCGAVPAGRPRGLGRGGSGRAELDRGDLQPAAGGLRPAAAGVRSQAPDCAGDGRLDDLPDPRRARRP